MSGFNTGPSVLRTRNTQTRHLSLRSRGTVKKGSQLCCCDSSNVAGCGPPTPTHVLQYFGLAMTAQSLKILSGDRSHPKKMVL
jgi:hypothetical protein